MRAGAWVRKSLNTRKIELQERSRLRLPSASVDTLRLETLSTVWSLVGAAGIEPATLGLEIRCSIRLSYAPAMITFRSELEQLEASPRRNACRLHCDFTARKACWPGRLCGWVLRLRSQVA
jgi:hypothetical protein